MLYIYIHLNTRKSVLIMRKWFEGYLCYESTQNFMVNTNVTYCHFCLYRNSVTVLTYIRRKEIIRNLFFINTLDGISFPQTFEENNVCLYLALE